MEGISTGTLHYKNQEFTFVFDDHELELIPRDSSIASSWIFKELENGLKTFNQPLQIDADSGRNGTGYRLDRHTKTFLTARYVG